MYVPATSALGRLRQENSKVVRASLGYIMTACLRTFTKLAQLPGNGSYLTHEESE